MIESVLICILQILVFMIDLKNELEILITQDNSPTILNKKIDETYHSSHGALQESMHIFIKNGIEQINKNKIKVLEIGLGTGLNAALTLNFSEKSNKEIEYVALEPFSPSIKLLNELSEYFSKNISNNLKKINNSEWNIENLLSPRFIFTKFNTRLQDFNIDIKFSIIYFDAFSPHKQPEMWIKEIFFKLYDLIEENGLLLTYSANGKVRRNLKEAGFKVFSSIGPPGKREITIAKKCL